VGTGVNSLSEAETPGHIRQTSDPGVGHSLPTTRRNAVVDSTATGVLSIVPLIPRFRGVPAHRRFNVPALRRFDLAIDIGAGIAAHHPSAARSRYRLGLFLTLELGSCEQDRIRPNDC
jgi:hypothetical protein